MGSSEERKERGQPREVLRSGTQVAVPTHIDAESREESEPQAITFRLVRIVRETHAATSIGDSVVLAHRDHGFDVLTTNGKLGEVPMTLYDAVQRSGLGVGAVVFVATDPLEAAVTLRS